MTTPPNPAHRRHSLLASLYFEPASTARVRTLAHQMDVVHNIAASADLVRADLMWLQEVGLARLKEDTATLTERGRDVATGVAEFPAAL